MSSILPWIKKQIGYFFNSLPEIIKGLLLCILAISGFGFAVLLRFFDQSGYIIMTGGIIVEILAMSVIYFVFKNYLKSDEENIKKLERKKKMK